MKIFKISVTRFLISVIIMAQFFILPLFVGTCLEIYPPECTNTFTEFFLYQRWFQVLSLGIAILSAIWLIIATVFKFRSK